MISIGGSIGGMLGTTTAGSMGSTSGMGTSGMGGMGGTSGMGGMGGAGGIGGMGGMGLLLKSSSMLAMMGSASMQGGLAQAPPPAGSAMPLKTGMPFTLQGALQGAAGLSQGAVLSQQQQIQIQAAYINQLHINRMNQANPSPNYNPDPSP